MTTDPGADYQRIMRDALQEYQLTNFAEAYALFEQAHQLQPSARTWRCLGMTSFELRQYVRAQAELRAALSDKRQPLTPSQHAEVDTLLDRVSRYIGTLLVNTKPPSASVALDGRQVSGEITLNLGEHELVVRAEGYRPVLRTLMVEGGKAQSVEIELTPLGYVNAASAPAPGEVARASETAHASVLLRSTVPAQRENLLVERWWFWTALGAVVAGSITAAVLLSAKPDPAKPESGSVGGTIVALGVQR